MRACCFQEEHLATASLRFSPITILYRSERASDQAVVDEAGKLKEDVRFMARSPSGALSLHGAYGQPWWSLSFLFVTHMELVEDFKT